MGAARRSLAHRRRAGEVRSELGHAGHARRLHVRIEQLLARLDDVQFAQENEFEPFPSFVIQGLNELFLTFKPALGESR